MFAWAFTFFLLSLSAALFAFTGVLTVEVAAVAKVLFILFVVFFPISFIFGLMAKVDSDKGNWK